MPPTLHTSTLTDGPAVALSPARPCRKPNQGVTQEATQGAACSDHGPGVSVWQPLTTKVLCTSLSRDPSFPLPLPGQVYLLNPSPSWASPQPHCQHPGLPPSATPASPSPPTVARGPCMGEVGSCAGSPHHLTRTNPACPLPPPCLLSACCWSCPACASSPYTAFLLHLEQRWGAQLGMQ